MTPRRLSLLLSLCIACGTASSDDTTGEDTSASASDTGATTQPAATDDPVDPTTAATTDAPDTTSEPGTSEPGTTDPDPTTDAPDPTTGDPTGDPPAFVLPPPDAGLDYQLGGAYDPPRGVGVLSRDRKDPPAAGLYSICYVNGYQAQPDEADFWLDEHPELILRDDDDQPIIDEDWNEMLLDIRTPESRAALAEIVGGWIADCGTAGYQGVEIDNLDSYDRSKGLLDQDQAVAYMALLSAAAHSHGMAIAQKNSTELLPRRDEMGTDFVVSEECNHYDECDDYLDVYGDAVLMIEYEDEYFANGCKQYPQISIVRRDVQLTLPGDPDYVYDAC